jgi:hypothetical protein
MELKSLSKRLVITGTLIIWLIKFLIRPLHLAPSSFDFVLGIAPNLLGSFLIPFGACWFFGGRYFMVARIFKTTTAYELRQVCLLSFGLLILNEYLQKITFFGRTFDPFDILFSAVGLTVSYFVFGRLQKKYAVFVSE